MYNLAVDLAPIEELTEANIELFNGWKMQTVGDLRAPSEAPGEIGEEIDPILLAEMQLQRQAQQNRDQNEQQKTATSKPMVRRCCGCCVLGPRKHQAQLAALCIFNLIVAGATGSLFVQGGFDWLVLTTLCLLSAVEFMMLYTALRDPGIIETADWDSLEVQSTVRQSCGIDDSASGLSECRIYQARHCSTCDITRPPLASHCPLCNVCVLGFDHHCTIFNTCVGVRNHRAFLVTVIFTMVAYLAVTATGIAFVIYEDLYAETIAVIVEDSGNMSSEQMLELGLDSAILILILIKFCLNLCCGKCVNFGLLVLWAVLEVILIEVLASVNWRNYTLNVGGFLLSIGTTFLLYTRVFLSMQLKLAAVAMTLKEYQQRKQRAADLCVRDPRRYPGCCAELANLGQFFCCRSKLDSKNL